MYIIDLSVQSLPYILNGSGYINIRLYIFYQNVGLTVWVNVQSTADVQHVRMEHVFRIVNEVEIFFCICPFAYFTSLVTNTRCNQAVNINGHIMYYFLQVVPLTVLERTVKDCVSTGVGELMTVTVT